MEQISESYKKATGRQIPAAPALAGKALVKFNSALQNVYVPPWPIRILHLEP